VFFGRQILDRPKPPRGFRGAVTIRLVMVAACAGRFRSATTSSMAGADGPGFGVFALTIRAGIAGDCFSFRARFGRWT
jgi:hypothetical protein